jgi:dCMP deaminase
MTREVIVSSRLEWDEYALKIAEVAALRSEDRYKKVGACALDKNKRVIGVAYNGLAPGKIVCESFWSDRERRRPFMIHAETNLLSLFKRGECDTLACTMLPCSQCAVHIVAHDVRRVIYGEVYKRDEQAKEIFDFYNIEVKQII